MMKRVAIYLVLFLVAAGSAHAAESIRIGLTLGLTGKYQVMSEMQRKGFRLWEKEVNQRGGILSREVQLLILDDKSDPRDSPIPIRTVHPKGQGRPPLCPVLE